MDFINNNNNNSSGSVNMSQGCVHSSFSVTVAIITGRSAGEKKVHCAQDRKLVSELHFCTAT